jgi:hypothetical protein
MNVDPDQEHWPEKYLVECAGGGPAGVAVAGEGGRVVMVTVFSPVPATTGRQETRFICKFWSIFML